MPNRDRVLNWWTGRVSDQDLAEWSGMHPRAVAAVMQFPLLRNGVTGGGRGSRWTRRVSPEARNAIGAIHALNAAGIPLELATNIFAATPILLSGPSRLVDFSENSGGKRMLAEVDPSGGWTLSDVVPWHVVERWLAPADENGKPIEAERFYAPDFDPLWWFAETNPTSEAMVRFDQHIIVIDGRWIFSKEPSVDPVESFEDLIDGITHDGSPVEFDIWPVSVIESDRKTVRVIGWGGAQAELDEARYRFQNFVSMQSANISLALRRMKRRAYGLPVDEGPSLS